MFKPPTATCTGNITDSHSQVFRGKNAANMSDHAQGSIINIQGWQIQSIHNCVGFNLLP